MEKVESIFPLFKRVNKIKKRVTQKVMILNFLIVFLVVFISAAWIPATSAQGFELVKDIYPGNYSSDIYYMGADNTIFFWANDDYGSVNRQLWTSNGTTAGTTKISSIDHNAYYSFAQETDTAAGNNYYFSLRRKSDDKYELWKADNAGVEKLNDIPDYIHDSCASGGLFFFVPFSDPTNYGRELWVSDGTTAGTKMVKDIAPGTPPSNPHDFWDINGVLYFIVGKDVWKSDGTNAGTIMVINFDEAPSYSRTNLVEASNGTLYIRRYPDVAVGNELWRYETATAQTSKIKTFTNLSVDSTHYAAHGGILYFINHTSTSPSDKYGLWKTNGTDAGTVLLKEWNGHTAFSSQLTNVKGTLFFRGGNYQNRELWKSDGTASGTILMKDIDGDPNYSSDLRYLTALGNTLFFAYKITSSVTELWMSDGTAAGTIKTDFRVSPTKKPVVFEGDYYFYGNGQTNSDYAAELYKYVPSSSAL